MRRARPSTFRAIAALLAVLVAGAVAGCGSDDESAGGGGAKQKSVIYVSTNPLGTNQFLNLIADGAKAGGKECGATVKVVQSSDPNTLAANLRAAAQAKPDLIVANSFDSVETIAGLVKQNPDQKWALVDAAVEKAPNVRGILFKENEGMFLIGAAYALLAKGDQGSEWPASKAVGFVGAIDNALVRRWYNGYAQGVNETSPGTRVLVGWGNSFNDPATSKELALSQNTKGAKYIAAVAAAGNSGVFEAAADRDFFTSGVDIDERPKDPEHIIVSMVKRSDQAVQQAVCDVAKGSFKGGRADARDQGERGRTRVPDAPEGPARGALEAARRGPGQAQGAQGAGRIGEAHGQAVTAVELLGTVKRYGSVTALDGVDLRVARGEVHAVVGENGAGKTTLMNVLAGVVAADAGEIRIHGEAVRIDSVEDAYGHGIGMVHQHFRLFRDLTVAENIVMGREPRRRGGYDHAAAAELVAELARRHGLRIDPRAKVGELSVGDQQRVEILRALHRAADVLILDEPTAVLTPQETEGLFAVARELAAEGRTVLFISHKLREVLEVSDTVTVMRRGQVTGTRPAADTDASELTRLMVGRAVHFDRVEPAGPPGAPALELRGLAGPGLHGIDLEVREGEIVGVAGVDGNGQTELVETLAGLRDGGGGHAAHRRRRSSRTRAWRGGARPASPTSPTTATPVAWRPRRRSPTTC